MANGKTGTGYLRPEAVAFWYFRLNGFLQMANFVVHPRGRGSQRTDADLLGVRFPHRAERLYDDPNDIMQDDTARLGLSPGWIEVVIVEVTIQPCKLNGPWTRRDRQNVHRVLAAIGLLPPDRIETAAESLYTDGIYTDASTGYRIRLMVVGRGYEPDLADRYPAVVQLVWPDLLNFIWHRFNRYKRQKKQVDQWDEQGLLIKSLADAAGTPEAFVNDALERMGVYDGDQST